MGLASAAQMGPTMALCLDSADVTPSVSPLQPLPRPRTSLANQMHAELLECENSPLGQQGVEAIALPVLRIFWMAT